MICRSLCFNWLMPWENNHHLPTTNMATVAQPLPRLAPASSFEVRNIVHTWQPLRKPRYS